MIAVLVRHGESEANSKGLVQGRGDYRLGDKGRDQALLTADALAAFRPYRIYTSPLARARETAEIINRRHNADMKVMPDLMEYDLGEFEGLLPEEIMERFPHVKPGLEKGVPFHLLAPGGEKDEDADERAVRAFDEIINSGLPRVVVVSHLGLLERILLLIIKTLGLDAPPPGEFLPLKNCSITRIEASVAGDYIHQLNDVSHLGDVIVRP